MSIRDVLVALDAGPSTQERLSIAATLARSHDAQLTGLHVVPPPDFAYTVGFGEFGSAGLIEKLIADYEVRTTKEAAAVEAQFTTLARQQDVTAAWLKLDGDPVGDTVAQARFTDLLVIGQMMPDGFTPSAPNPADVIISCGKPVLVTPHAGKYTTIGRRVLIAWDGSRESTRAVADALPLLRKADAVTILTIDEDSEQDTGTLPAAEPLARHLSRHGVHAELIAQKSDGKPAGDLLLAQAADRSIDLLVMGCYGHSRFRELILGGATETMLDSMTVPVLFSH